MKVVPCLLVAGALALGGCSSSGSTGSPLLADKVIQLTADTSIKLSSLATAVVVAAAIYVVYDPLAPNWEIEEARLNDNTYRLSMKMKRFHTGGSGESIQLLKRRASQLQHEQGFSQYQILEYSEGIDSQTIGARRMAEGVIRLVRQEQANSFLQN
ncbi:MAG: hypothetical protein CVU34_13025 [Betaproteobacteria bacterium HGW-Betaproteobacteria-7]|jgi:hypothetical protein|nr:MAG: hypothetical protein CVU34_13025 [Betaproteobacteria bacterium HGW-Betaproteobacteria-7]